LSQPNTSFVAATSVRPRGAIDEVSRELIVAGWHRRVRGEHTLSADLFEVLARDARVAGLSGLFVEQRQR
jgi:hypothetical protein